VSLLFCADEIVAESVDKTSDIIKKRCFVAIMQQVIKKEKTSDSYQKIGTIADLI
jgi:hypothetical protein